MLQELTYSDTSSAGNRVGAPPIRVLLVDDHPAVRYGIRHLIADEPDMVLIAEHGRASADTREVAAWAGARLGLAPGEVETRRTLMLRVIAPRTGRARVIATARSPLDYDRPRRRLRYRAVG